MWTSAEVSDRTLAAKWCVGCRISRECGEAADEFGEKYYVYGGRDYGRKSGKTKAAAA
jgi:hypothetical protein